MAALALAFTLAFALSFTLSVTLTFARLALRRRGVRIALGPIAATGAATASATATIAATSWTIGIPRLFPSAILAPVLGSRRTFGSAAFGHGPVQGPRVLSVALGRAALAVPLGRTRLARTIRSAATLLLLLVPILVAPALRLGLTLGPRTLLRRYASALGTGTLLPIVGPSAAAAAVAEATLAFAARTVGVEFLLGAPGDFAAAGVVLGHEGSGEVRGGVAGIVVLVDVIIVLLVVVPLVVFFALFAFVLIVIFVVAVVLVTLFFVFFVVLFALLVVFVVLVVLVLVVCVVAAIVVRLFVVLAVVVIIFIVGFVVG
jgi:hypothetical protein